jgi:hypothetical protein
LSDELALLRRCSLDGAKKIVTLVDAAAGKESSKETLIRFWADNCRKAGQR